MGQKENTFVVITDITKLPFLGQLHANTNTKLICEDFYFKHVTLGLPPTHIATAFLFQFYWLFLFVYFSIRSVESAYLVAKEKKTIYFKITLLYDPLPTTWYIYSHVSQ